MLRFAVSRSVKYLSQFIVPEPYGWHNHNEPFFQFGTNAELFVIEMMNFSLSTILFIF